MIGSPHVHYRVTGSTNERAKELAQLGAAHGTLVTADEQTAGRGRQGRTWAAPPRSALLMSVVLRDFDRLLPLAAAVAICEAVDAPCAIKWPNDVWIDGRKLSGILVEGRPQSGWAVLGIGLNVTTEAFPPELAQIATSLRLAGVDTTVEAVLGSVVARLDRWLGAPTPEVLSAWRTRDALRGQPVRWTAGEGRGAGVDDAGNLLVDTPTGQRTLAAGEVHLLR